MTNGTRKGALTARCKYPCFGCERREVGCRRTCEEYQAAALKEAERKALERKNRDLYNAIPWK